jgi:hypothetical protein
MRVRACSGSQTRPISDCGNMECEQLNRESDKGDRDEALEVAGRSILGNAEWTLLVLLEQYLFGIQAQE